MKFTHKIIAVASVIAISMGIFLNYYHKTKERQAVNDWLVNYHNKFELVSSAVNDDIIRNHFYCKILTPGRNRSDVELDLKKLGFSGGTLSNNDYLPLLKSDSVIVEHFHQDRASSGIRNSVLSSFQIEYDSAGLLLRRWVYTGGLKIDLRVYTLECPITAEDWQRFSSVRVGDRPRHIIFSAEELRRTTRDP